MTSEPAESCNDLPTRSDADLATERYRFLLSASTMLSASLDYGSAIEALGRAAVPALADLCVIDMLDQQGRPERVYARGTDPVLAALVESAQPNFGSDHPVVQALQSGEQVLASQAGRNHLVLVAGSEQAGEELVNLKLTWSLTVPIVARSRLGAITLLSPDGLTELRWSDLAPQLAEDLARRAALALDNAKLIESSRNLAITLQRSLMPEALPHIEGLELAAGYQAGGEGAEVGGDFYDVFPTGPTGADGWAAVIGDVCGKGAEPAALSALARHTIRAANVELRKPRRILGFLNQIVLQNNLVERFISVAYCRMKWNGDCLRVTLGVAGHPAPLVLRKDGTVTPQGRPGMLIGVVPDPELTDQAVQLNPGDALVLYTDGVTEARGPHGRFGQRRLEATLAACRGMSARGISDRLETQVLNFQLTLARDDMAILVIKVQEKS